MLSEDRRPTPFLKRSASGGRKLKYLSGNCGFRTIEHFGTSLSNENVLEIYFWFAGTEEMVL